MSIDKPNSRRARLRPSKLLSYSCLGLASVASAAAESESAQIERVTVSASRLRDEALVEVPASVTVISEAAIRDSAQQHFQEVLSQVPNLNWAAGSSRPRY